MKTITKILICAGAIAFVSCGEVTKSVKIDVPGTLAESGNSEDLISFGSISEKKFYVSQEKQEYAISRLNGELLDSTSVVFVFDKQKMKFKIEPMGKLDFNRELEAGDYGTWENMVCSQFTTEGQCINMDDEASGKFLFSMKVPKGGFSYCKSQKNETCDWVWVLFNEATWLKEDCKGNPAGNQLVRVCYDNNS
ncbi:hypothetical protein FVB32_05375 [Flagellimonas hymeniacidonis]|uniref:Lipoprotein n=1 Tax=Flagellimonas hymeniacidonis TaxID=2603628 RepID=A0A5C8V951_9FLAO|nr:hypothetical protein [Flagellimonas hymeniacidonis]TXN37720.1 hypothetical protein FVB32_05375 [Flagellimonas hymeniacidonis]